MSSFGFFFSIDLKSSSKPVRLSLVSLIDTFSILVIYLLLVTQDGIFDFDPESKVHLPQTQHAPLLLEELKTIEWKNGQLLHKDLIVTKELVKKWQTQSLKIGLVADESIEFSEIQKALKNLNEMGVEKVELLTQHTP